MITEHAEDQDEHEQDGRRRPLRVLGADDLAVDVDADGGDRPLADHLDGAVLAHRQHEDEDRADDDARHRLREDHLAERAPPVAAEVARSLERVPVDLREQEEDRRDHEQDVELDHRQLHG